MNLDRPIRRLARICTAALAAVLACAAAPAVLATPWPQPPGWNKHPPVPPSPPPALRYPPGWNKHPPLPAHAHALVTNGMPGWQITLIAAAAALLATALAVLATRLRATRRHLPARSAWPAATSGATTPGGSSARPGHAGPPGQPAAVASGRRNQRAGSRR